MAAAREFSFETLEAPIDPSASADAVMEAMVRAEADAAAAFASARAEGLRAGREEALTAMAPAVEALGVAVEALQAEQLARATRLEAHAVDLALFLAERVLGGALAVQPERVVEAVRGALRGIVERERVTILVHPEDLDVVREAMDGLRVTLGGIEHCEVQAERRVTRGGAVVRTPDGDVDARVDTKLQRAREVVEAALAAAS